MRLAACPAADRQVAGYLSHALRSKHRRGALHTTNLEPRGASQGHFDVLSVAQEHDGDTGVNIVSEMIFGVNFVV